MDILWTWYGIRKAIVSVMVVLYTHTPIHTHRHTHTRTCVILVPLLSTKQTRDNFKVSCECRGGELEQDLQGEGAGELYGLSLGRTAFTRTCIGV